MRRSRHTSPKNHGSRSASQPESDRQSGTPSPDTQAHSAFNQSEIRDNRALESGGQFAAQLQKVNRIQSARVSNSASHGIAPGTAQLQSGSWQDARDSEGTLINHNSSFMSLLSERGAKNESTWQQIQQHIEALIGLARREPNRLKQFQEIAGNCLILIGEWRQKHSAPLLIGKDTWTRKSTALNQLETTLSKFSSGAMLQVPESDHSAAASASATAPANHATAQLDNAIAQEAVAFGIANKEIRTDISRMNTKYQEAIRKDISRHLIAYVNALHRLSTEIYNARASGANFDQARLNAADEHIKQLGAICRQFDWSQSIRKSDVISVEEADNHNQRVAFIRSRFTDFERAAKPDKREKGGAEDVAEEFIGSPLTWFFG